MAYHFWRSGGAGSDKYNCTKCLRERRYLGLNCRHPKLIQLHNPNGKMIWSATYSGRQKQTISQGPRLNECPQSYVTDESRAFLSEFHHQRLLKEAGVSGISQGDLPIPMAEAFAILVQEENKLSHALQE